MDERTLEMIRQIHEAVTSLQVPMYVCGPIIAGLSAAFGVLWRYHGKVQEGLVSRLDAGGERERDSLNQQINRNEAQFERMADLAQAIKDNTDAVKTLNGD